MDATCVKDTCVSGYRWVSGLGCMKCSTADCSAVATCSGANSIADQCAAAFKECDDSGAEAVCAPLISQLMGMLECLTLVPPQFQLLTLHW